MGIKLALIGIENGMSDPPRQVNIGCPDGNLALGMVYAHDPLQGMFFRSATSVWRASSIISCLCPARKPPLKINSPAGKLSWMRWQAGQSSLGGGYASLSPIASARPSLPPHIAGIGRAHLAFYAAYLDRVSLLLDDVASSGHAVAPRGGCLSFHLRAPFDSLPKTRFIGRRHRNAAGERACRQIRRHNRKNRLLQKERKIGVDAVMGDLLAVDGGSMRTDVRTALPLGAFRSKSGRFQACP